jgi:DNA-binding LacI/PurR family transcriptional regulator
MSKRPTIKDVAKKAGVSIATVSFVLNKHPNEVISDKVKKRVWAAARQLDYHPSATAAGLARKRTRNVAIIFYLDEGIISNQFYSFVIQGAIKEAMDRNYHLLFSYMDAPYHGAADLPKVVQERNAEGVLFLKQIEPKMVRDIQSRGLPVVAIDHFPAMKQLSSMQIDNRRGGFIAAEHLVGLGHRNLGILQAAADRPSIAARVAGFRAALQKHGVSFGARTNVLDCKSLTFEAGYERVLRSLKRDPRLTALFCVNDEMAAGALRAAHGLGLSVPRDLSVVGFDDITMSNYTDPPLTTVGVVKDELGRRAIARLVELVEDPSVKNGTETVGVDLVVRASTAEPPGSASRSRKRR